MGDSPREANFAWQLVRLQGVQVKRQRRRGRADKVLNQAEVRAVVPIVARLLGTMPGQRTVVVTEHLEFPDEGDAPVVAHLDRFAVKFEAAGNDPSAGFQQAVAEINDIGDNGLVEEEVAHLLVQDHVYRTGCVVVSAMNRDEVDRGQPVVGG